uniref:3CxxC-type domain-containing protein n=1 Tax=Eptatretus burgeri TaxID=7764 RepID=A0A8C4QTC7_EPTBU
MRTRTGALPQRHSHASNNDATSKRGSAAKEHSHRKFFCETCQHKWTSIEGKVIFHFRLPRNDVHGVVRVRTFKQACAICISPSNIVMVEPSWYEDEREVVLSRLKKRIRKIYYDAPMHRAVGNNDNSRRAQMGAPHRQDLCEACRLGVCAETNQPF